MIRVSHCFAKFQVNLWRNLNLNWGCFFVAAFILVIAIVGFISGFGTMQFAERILDVEYFSLTVGVILQLSIFSQKVKRGLL
jgi:hypothetical protein